MGRKSKWLFLNEETARAYYLEHFEGRSRSEVKKEDVGFYAVLRRKGLMEILPESKMEDFWDECSQLRNIMGKSLVTARANKSSQRMK